MSELRDLDLELAAGYALGVLDDAERREVERRLAAGDAALQRAIDEFAQASAMIGAAEPASMPSPRLRDRVLSEARQAKWDANSDAAPARGPRAAPGSRQPWGVAWGWGWAAAAAALAVITFMQYDAGRRLERELQAARGELDQVHATLEQERAVATVLGAPGALQVKLGITPAADSTLQQLAAVATYDPATQQAVVSFEHFTAPSGRDYQLWAIRGGKPASLGVVKVDSNGKARMWLHDVGAPADLAAFAVSLEPLGGSQDPAAPSGPVIMVGAIAKVAG